MFVFLRAQKYLSLRAREDAPVNLLTGGIEMQEILNFIEIHFLILLVCSALLGCVIGAAQYLVNLWGIKWGILFRWGSWWIGGHWSDHNKRLCVNIVPMVTLWITAEGGETPDIGYGFDIYRNDK